MSEDYDLPKPGDAELLFEQYRETNAKNQSAIKTRNWYFVALLVVVGISAVLASNPDLLLEVILSVARERFGMEAPPLNAGAADVMSWTATLYLFMRYVQLAIGIERSYAYLNALERDLRDALGSDAFCREGDVYARDYPFALNLVDFVYKVVFPFAFLLACLAHMLTTVKMGFDWPYLMLAVLMFGLTVILLFSYWKFLLRESRNN